MVFRIPWISFQKNKWPRLSRNVLIRQCPGSTSKDRKLPGKAAERRQAVKRNIIISVIIGTLATYLPFWQWDGLQVAGAIALSMLAWMLIQGTEPEGRRP